jgi:hypothetical protein
MPFIILILATSTFLIVPVKSDSDHFSLIDVYWGTNDPVEVSPGDVATLTIILRYEADNSFNNLQAILDLPSGFKAVGGGMKATVYHSGSISPGSLLQLEFPIFITTDVKIGTHRADLEVEYYVSNVIVPVDELSVKLEVTGKPSIDLMTPIDYIHEGKQEVPIVVTNVGDALMQNLQIINIYSSDASVELLNGKLWGDLEPGENTTVLLLVHVLTEVKGEALSFNLEFSFLGPNNIAYSSSETLQVLMKATAPTSPLRVDLNTTELDMGIKNKIYIDLVNDGLYDLVDIELTLSPGNNIQIFGSRVLHVNVLASGETKRIEIESYVPATSEDPTTLLTTTVTYFDTSLSTFQSETYELRIILRGLIDVSLTDYVVIPETPSPGDPISITFTITNMGASRARSASAEAQLEGLPLTPYGQMTTYIGNINTDQPTTFTINLQLQQTNETSITVPITLTYLDNLRTSHDITFDIPVTIETQQSQPTNPSEPSQPSQGDSGESFLFSTEGMIVVATGIVIFVVVIIWVLRRRA